MTVRLPTHIAERMTARARASGASYGTYLSSLIEDAPPMPALAHRREALVKLGASTDRLAAVFVDLKHLDRLLHDRCESATHLALDSLSTMVAELRSHLALASGVISELKPSANRSVPASNTGLSQQG
ncbi:MAG TPA: hypothetical protein VMW56_07600 [Candidatus Margulisiibacteriota bacterium]|nr:hypothetical protein [Candidatus Margulisiibacteriota bacterium]